MESVKMFINILKLKYKINLTVETNQYYSMIFQSCLAEEKKILDELREYVAAGSPDEKTTNIIIEELHRAMEKNKKKSSKQAALKINEEKNIQLKKDAKPLSDDEKQDQLNKQEKELFEHSEPKKIRKLSEVGEQSIAQTNLEKKGLKKQLQAEGKQKCRYFPFCKNKDCIYFHPNEKCQFFPRCYHGANCLYMHEACKFKGKCHNINCGYDHPNKGNVANRIMQNMMKMVKNKLHSDQEQASQ